jgi:hypothetical protein
MPAYCSTSRPPPAAELPKEEAPTPRLPEPSPPPWQGSARNLPDFYKAITERKP